MIKILADTHTHTNCSTHAFGTIIENITEAKKRGIELVCMTDHGPQIPDAPHIWHFETMAELPEEIDGVRLIKGAEANILDVDGSLDFPVSIQKKMDMMIASIHRPCFKPHTVEEHTKTWLNVIKNPYVTVLGHMGQTAYQFEHEPVIEAAKAANKCIEINNHSFAVRPGSDVICGKIAEYCKKIGAKIVVSSDAHAPFQVGVFDKALAVLEKIDFPENLIMNLNRERFERYLKEFKN